MSDAHQLSVEAQLAELRCERGAQQLADFLAEHDKTLVITGAGCSTDSGIGDYRDEAGQWKHSEPVQYADFMRHAAVRRRYWARSLIGWPQFAAAAPNPAHIALVACQRMGYVGEIITQNVDRLHQRAGHVDVLDLHGRLDEVRCQSCTYQVPRVELQGWLVEHNPSYVNVSDEDPLGPAPDGDARVEAPDADFQVPACPLCQGILKPAVVFYGESVPRAWVTRAQGWLAEADALLVVGSSLMVFSSFRFCRAAAAADKPIAILNNGVTRADSLARLKLEEGCAGLLTRAVVHLRGEAQ